MGKIFSNLGSRIWFIVTCVLVVLLVAVNIVANTVLYDIACQLFGRARPITKDGTTQVFIADFTTKEDARKNGEKVNESVCEEGMVLLYNKGNALPIPENSKISVFGNNSVNLVTGGSGSAGGSAKYTVSLDKALENSGFSVNKTLWDFYVNANNTGKGRPSNPDMNSGGALLTTGELPWSDYTSAVKDSFSTYKDCALIVISRIGGEGWDLPRTMQKNGVALSGAHDPDDHYLQLDANEAELIKQVGLAGFSKVVIALNLATTFETGFLDDPTHYGYSDKIDACIWMGVPGDTGANALGKILKGEVNPSGKTVDTWARNFKDSPVWQNFGDNFVSDGGLYTDVADKNLSYTYSFVDYEEGIYVGYRYYETRAESESANWYKNQVVYPFGHGLSYTTFNQEISNKGSIPATIAKGQDITIKVKVSNTGSKSGRDAVQIYVTPPYTAGGIEKSAKNLVGIAKTDVIDAGRNTEETITIDPYSFASYDYQNKKGGGYILEKGNYVFTLGVNAHDAYDTVTLNVPEDIRYDKDPATEYTLKNLYDDADDELGTVLSRNNWAGSFPAVRTNAERKLSAATNAGINSLEVNNPKTYTEFPDQGVEQQYDEEGNPLITLRSMVGKDYNDKMWDQLLDILTVDEMKNLVNKGAFKSIAISSIGKPETIDADGPAGFADFMAGDATSPIYEVSHYCCEPTMAATFNVDRLEDVGEAIGNEALVGNLRTGMPYSGWYGPAMNIHRSQFGGRVGEYYSEDPFISGILGAAEIKGAMSKGLYTMVKHLAVNEQETHRTGVATWLTEQSLREIYLKPFEYAVKKGKTIGMMSSFNRIGTRWTGGDWRLCTEILRNEWGFRGMVISDYNTGDCLNVKQMAYGGTDLDLAGPGQAWNPRKSDATDMNILRQCAKNILYTVTQSNIMNTEVLGYNLPIWQVVLIIADCVIAAGLIGWGVFAVMKAFKKS